MLLILWNPKARYRIHKRPSPVPILNHSNPVHASPFQILKHYCNIILLSKSRPSKWPLSIRSLHKNPICTSPVPHTFHIPRPPHYSWFDQPNNIRLKIRRHRTKMSRPGGLAPGICAHLQLSHKGYKPQHTCTSQQQGIKIWSDDVKKSITLIDREA
jgi:hypothetical protein